MISLRKLLDQVLVAIGVVSLASMFFAHENPFARDWWCGLAPCATLPNATPGYKILYDLAVGTFVTLIFYFLVVRLPDYRKRLRFKKLIVEQYRSFKIKSISMLLGLADGSYSAGHPEKLISQHEFKEYFKAQNGTGEDRWSRVANSLDDYHVRELLKACEKFRDDIAFFLNNVDVPDDKPFEFLNRLSDVIFQVRDTTTDYDDIKSLCRFLWEILAGWDWVEGYRKTDIIQDMIDAI
ncbi:hypothetical protein [Tardiphaga sp. vice278]|uniref:hypothetical protein n=1 Tax=Tardiphaga sp. vice278 TaxID=2592815 RepID=UPI001165C36F|nr:hypothetical protein [Tardiphaga sp. vice278]QDM18844.1 hypothetical protein FNL53_24990 [Tardiphaga sp. vice278]